MHHQIHKKKFKKSFSQASARSFAKTLFKYVCFVLNITLVKLTRDRYGLVYVGDKIQHIVISHPHPFHDCFSKLLLVTTFLVE